MATTMATVRFDGVTKRFPGVVALDGVTFDITAGSCHALCGENGAGKSTLGKLLAGIYAPDEGRVLLDGAPVRFTSPTDALKSGVAMVHQELSFCENLSVAENLCLGSLPSKHGFVSKREMRRRAEEMLAPIDVALDVTRPVGALTIGQQQMLQIASAIGQGARLIVFDEPTSSLSQHEAERLYAIIGRLRERGVTCIYVSHRLEEIFRLCDTVTVLRDGRHVATRPAAELDQARLVEMMIGRRVEEYFPAHVRAEPGAELLRVARLSSPAGFSDVAFSLRAGEVLGFAGLVGAGRSEVATALFGLDRHSTGDVWVRGQPVSRASASQAIALGIGLVPEDRKRQGLVLGMDILNNATMSILPRLARLGFVTRAGERAGRAALLRPAAREGPAPRHAGRRALGRQPAEDRPHQVARGRVPDPDSRRADAWRGRRRQGRDPRPHRRARRRGQRHHPHLERDAGSAQPLDPHPRLPRRPRGRRAVTRRRQPGSADAPDGGGGGVGGLADKGFKAQEELSDSEVPAPGG